MVKTIIYWDLDCFTELLGKLAENLALPEDVELLLALLAGVLEGRATERGEQDLITLLQGHGKVFGAWANSQDTAAVQSLLGLLGDKNTRGSFLERDQ